MYTFCIDIDNCITKTDELIRKIIFDYTGGNVKLEYNNITNFDYYKCKDSRGRHITYDQWKKVHEIFSESDNILKLEPISGAIKYLKKLNKIKDIHIHLVTTRLSKARKPTIEWLEKNDLAKFNLHFLRHRKKHLMFKSFTAVIEDDFDQAIDFINNTKTHCFIIKHPWNDNRESIKGIEWVDNWDTLFQKIKHLTNNNS